MPCLGVWIPNYRDPFEVTNSFRDSSRSLERESRPLAHTGMGLATGPCVRPCYSRPMSPDGASRPTHHRSSHVREASSKAVR